jgi:hypothetical protein
VVECGVDKFWIVTFVLGGFVAVVLSVLLLRGRFGTTQEQGDYTLREMLSADEIPAAATRKSVGNCRGHSLQSRQVLGAGVLWATDDEVGFLLRNARRQFRIKRSTIAAATVSSSFSRTGIEETSDRDEFLIVDWYAGDDLSQIVFQLTEPAPWAEELAPLDA